MSCLYFHRHPGVLRSHTAQHKEELRAEAGGGQPHGRQVGEECFYPQVRCGAVRLSGGGGESLGVGDGDVSVVWRYQLDMQSKGLCCQSPETVEGAS